MPVARPDFDSQRSDAAAEPKGAYAKLVQFLQHPVFKAGNSHMPVHIGNLPQKLHLGKFCDLVLGRKSKFPLSPLVRVPASARAAHMYVIGMSGKGKSRLVSFFLLIEKSLKHRSN